MDQNNDIQQGMPGTGNTIPAGQGGEAPANAVPQAEQGGPMNPGPTGSTGMNPGPAGAAGANPGSTGAVGMNPGPAGVHPGGYTSPNPQMGAPPPYTGPSQAGMYPGQSSGMGQVGSQPWGYPGNGSQGADGVMGQPGSGYMGADAHHIYHDENRFGQIADIVDRFVNGEATTGDIVKGLFSLDFRNDQFWKGAIVGAVAALVVNSDTVKQGLATTFGAVFPKSEEKIENEEKPGKKKQPDAKKKAK